MTDTTTHKAEKERIAGVLRTHAYALTLRTGAICECGYAPPREPERLWSQQEWHVDHLADVLSTQPGVPATPGLSCSALWSRNQGVSCCVDTPHTVHRGSDEPDAPTWDDTGCVPGTLHDGRGGR